MKIFISTIVLLLTVPIVFAEINTYEINYNIGLNKVSENIHITFYEDINNEIQIIFTNNIRIIEIRDNIGLLKYDLLSNKNTILKIYTNFSKEIFIKLDIFDSVLSYDKYYQFIVDFTTNENISKLIVSAMLPKGYVIYKNFYLPQNAEIITDGERITLLWIENNVKSTSKIYSLKFTSTVDYSFIFILFIIVIILIVVLFLFFRYYKKKILKELKKGFSDDEKKVIDILLKEKTIYQNKIEKELKFSRAKMTRITEKLKQKGLIEKKRYGRTNKLIWKS